MLSPTTARTDRALKLPRYAAAGVVHCWLPDPDARTLEAYENAAGRWVLLGAWGGDDAPRVPPFDAIALPLANLSADRAGQDVCTPSAPGLTVVSARHALG
jgi:Uma2 family endonuclease